MTFCDPNCFLRSNVFIVKRPPAVVNLTNCVIDATKN
jgi:hypothetical protein